MTRPLVRIALGAAIVAVIGIGVVWWTGVLVPRAPNERPQLAETPPLPAVSRSSLIVAPVAIRLSAIQEAVERNIPRDLTGEPNLPSFANIPGLKLTWSLAREPFTVTGTPAGVQLSGTLRGGLIVNAQLPVPGPIDQPPMTSGPAPLGDPPFGLPDMPKEVESELRELLGPFAPPPTPRAPARPPQDNAKQASPQRSASPAKTNEQRVEVSGAVVITVRPALRADWRVEPNLTAQVTIANAQMSLMGTTMDLSDDMKRIVEGLISQQVARAQSQLGDSQMLREAVQSEWTKMCHSTPLGDGPPGTPALWLEMRPTQAMAAAQPRIDGNAVTLTLGVRAETRILTTESKPNCPLPAQLDLVPQMDQGQINVDLPIDIPFVEINRMIGAELKGQTFPLDEGGAFTATVNSVEVAPSGDRLLLALHIRAKETKTMLGLGADATIYVWGRPVPDRKAQKLRFTDVTLDVRSDAAFGALGFVARAATPYMQKMIADNAEIDWAPTIADARKNIEAGLAEFRQQQSDVQLDAQITDVSLAGIQFDAKTLRFITSLEGTVRVDVMKLNDK